MATQYDNESEEMIMTCDLCGNDETFYGEFKACIAQSKEAGWKTFKEGDEWCNKCPAHDPDEQVSKSASKPKVTAKPKPEPKRDIPFIGAVVHFVTDGLKHKAAIITDINPFDQSVSLQIFPIPVTVEDAFRVDVPYEETEAVDTWHWPEIE